MATVFVTGSSTGLGLLSARWLVARGHRVTLHARDRAKAAQVGRELPGCEVVVGDLGVIEQVRGVAAQVNALDRHDAVIHNAGVYREPVRRETADGLSMTFAVNVLAPYLLTALIEPPDRLVYMTSGLQSGGAPDLDDAQYTRRRWNWMQAYSDSKLFDTMLAFGVARRRPGVFSNAVTPGWVATRMGGAGAPDDLQLGAETQAWLAAGDDDETHVTATCFYHREPQPTPSAVRSEQNQESLFAYCERLTGTAL